MAYYSIKIPYLQVNLSWVGAQGECENLGGFLAEAKTWEENQFLQSEAVFIEVQTTVLFY